MNRSIYVVGLMGVLGCSGAGSRAGVHATTPALAGRAPRVEVGSAPANPPLEYHDETEADRVFIENAERAIAQYSEFLARAGDSPEYAPAVKRSREQIEDLRAALVFVRAGAAQRAAH